MPQPGIPTSPSDETTAAAVARPPVSRALACSLSPVSRASYLRVSHYHCATMMMSDDDDDDDDDSSQFSDAAELMWFTRSVS